jgi:hypothetical protein
MPPALRLAALVAAMAAVSCTGDTAGPRQVHEAAFSLAPAFATSAAGIVAFDRVRITLSRSGTTVVDTTVNFPADADSLVLRLLAPITGESETLTLNLAMINAAGDTVFRGGPLPVTVRATGSGPGVLVPVRYAGIGADAAGVRIATRSAALFFGDSLTLAAAALDSSGAPIPGTPIAWRSLDTALARVPSDTSGKVIAGPARGVARIEASLPTGQADTVLITVEPVPAAIAVLSGGGQAAAAGTALPQPVVFRVKAADSLGVAGVAVSFAVASGGGSLAAAADTTDANGDVSAAWTLGAALGAQSMRATVVAVPTLSATAGATGIVGPPKRLAFQVQPSNVNANVAMAPPVVVVAQDSLGNTAAAFTGTVTLTLAANPGGASLSGTVTAAAVAGVATFPSLVLDLPGSGYTLAASAAGLASDTSAAFTVSGGVPARLAFVQQPGGAAAGATLAAVTVQVLDGNGIPVPTAATPVQVAILSNPGNGTLTGTTTVNAVAGVATFGDLVIDRPGAGYTLEASATGLAGDTSSAFTIGAGAASQLAFTTGPASTTAGAPFGVVVTARDTLGNTATGFTGSVAIAITGGTGTAGAALRGTTTVTAVAGVASFAGLSVDSAGTGYTLTATATGLATAVGAAFTVAAAPASRLAFTTQPANTTAGAPFGVVVTARDSLGNTATGFAGSVVVAITGGTGKAGAAMRGTTSVNASAGVASFTGLSVDSAGSGYTLTATASGMPADTSAAFGVAPAPASRLAFTLEPPASVTAGATFSIVVAARDSLGNLASGFGGTVTLALSAGTGTAGAALRGTTAVAAASGVATFGGLSVDSVGTGYTLTATATGLADGVSSAFDVGAAPATQLVFTAQPANTTAGTGFGVVVTARDGLGNTATGFTGDVALSITSGTGTVGAALRGTTTVAASAGVASFTGLSVDSAGTGYTLTAAASGAGSAGSQSFDVAPAPASRLMFTAQPGNTTAGTPFGVVVTAHDSLGNTATGFAGSVSVAITSGTGTTGASLRGTTTVNAVGGVATFAGLSVDSAGTGYALTATGAGTATSQAFAVGPAPAARLVFTGQPPSSTPAGAGFAITVEARDSLGNVATGFGGTVTAAITSGTGTAGASLRGATAASASAGVAAFTGLNVDSAGTGYTLTAISAGLTPDTSTAFTVVPGSAVALAFTVQPPLNTPSQAPFGFTVAALDAGGNVATGFSGTVMIGFAVNPVNGTLSGPLSGSAVGGVVAFSGVSIDNIGSGYQLSATATGVGAGTSAVFNIVAAGNVNAWINPAGGSWSVASNWSKGTVPVATDTVAITQSGTYTVNVDANATFARLDVGGPSGTQTLQVAANTLTAGNGAFAANTVLSLSGAGTITGTGTLSVAGTFDWTGGSLGGSGGGGMVQVLAGGTLTIAPLSVAQLEAYTLELDGAGSWTGSGSVNSGSGATLRVGTGGALTVSGDPTFSFNLGGGAPLFENLGTVTRSTSANPFVVNVPIGGTGTWNVQSGALDLGGGGTVDGALSVAAGATLGLTGGTLTLSAAASVTGAGTVDFGGATVHVAGAYGVSGATVVSGGAANFDGANGSADSLDLTGGALGGSGLLTVSGPMIWSGGNLNGAGGTTRVLASGTLGLALAANAQFQNYTLELAGAGTWTGTATVAAGSAAVLRVLAGGTLDIQGDPLFTYTLGGGAPAFDIAGTVSRTTSANAALVSVAFNDSGAVTVQSGTLQLAGGGTSSGSFAVSGGATLLFAGGTHALASSSSISGAGTVSLSAGAVDDSGSYAITGTTSAGGGTINFDGASSSTAALEVVGGTVGGSGLLAVSGPMTWTSGNLSGTGGTTRVLAGGTLSLAPASTVQFQAYTLELAGTGTWTGTSAIDAGSGAVLRVASGGTLDIQGDPYLVFALGGATPLFDDQGTVNRTTSLNAAVVEVPFTLAGALNVQSGLMTLADGGTLSGTATLAGTTVLELGGGTFALANNFKATGSTAYTALLGGTLTGLASSDTAFFDNLQLGGGTVSLSGGTIKTAVELFWNQTTSVTGGTLYVPPGAALGLNLLAPAALTNATILNAGTAAFTAADTLGTGQGAVIRNLPGGTFAFSAPGAILYDQGGAAPLFDNQGTLTVAPSSGAVDVGTPFANSGSVQVLGDTLRLSAGAGGTFPGALSVASGAVLDLASSFNLGGTLSVGGALRVSGGTLVVNGRSVAVSGDFATAGTGTLQMTLGTDSLDVGGNATFGGGPSQLSGGVIRVAGNFAQTGSASFAPTGTQRTVLYGGAPQTIAFADAVNDFFRYLEANKTAGGVTFGTNARVSGSLRLLSATAVTGPAARVIVGDSVTSNSLGSSFAPLVAEIGMSIRDSGSFSPDTTVFTGSNQVIPNAVTTAYNYQSIRVAQSSGTATFAVARAIPKDLVVSSGILSLTSRLVGVQGNFRTEGTGALQMTTSRDSLGVTGSATFAGGSTAGLLGAGRLSVGGDFTQAGTASAFAPTGAFSTTLNGSGNQNLSFAAPGSSYFAELDVASTGARIVTLQSNVVVNDSLQAFGGAAPTTILGAGNSQRLTVNGTVYVYQSTSSPLLKPPVLEVAHAPFVQPAYPIGGVAADTLVLLPGITAFPIASGIHLNSVRVATNGVVTDASNGNQPDSVTGNLTIDGASALALTGNVTFPLVVAGDLVTTSAGVLQMRTAGTQVVVKGSASFGGGSTTGQLTQGTLYLAGNFSQSGNAASFATDSGFSTILNGSTAAGQQITFANPGMGSGASHFMFLEDVNTAGPVTLNSNVFVNNSLADSNVTGESIVGTASTVLTTQSVYLNGFKFTGAPLVVVDTATETAFTMSSVTFGVYDPTVDQLTVQMTTGRAASTTSAVFNTPPSGAGHYLHLEWNVGSPGTAPALTMTSASPGAQGGTATVLADGTVGTPTIVWP